VRCQRRAERVLHRRVAEALAGQPDPITHGLRIMPTLRGSRTWRRGTLRWPQRMPVGAICTCTRRSPRSRCAVRRAAVRPAGDALLWAARCGDPISLGADAPLLPEPVRLELAGEWRGAIRAWRQLDAPDEAALAALPGDERAARAAMMTLQRLGALATSRAVAREREARGAASLRGPRRSTLASPAGADTP
jgi:hypothetical protein